jgi:hypothetical protein
MRAWLESIAGPEYASALIWTLGALILLLIILVVVRIVRGLTFGTFVAGGRNRKTRSRSWTRPRSTVTGGWFWSGATMSSI